jgi:predicted adenine nucleotide alpha hydrolase (AANH) superfamily ATPase
MKTLLHICCAPCSITCIQTLRADGIEPVGYWNNLNIHPFTEYRARRDALVEYAKTIDLQLVQDGGYGLRPFTAAVAAAPGARCTFCYTARLEATACYAAQNGFEAFCTTLQVSPYQNHALLLSIGQQLGAQYNVQFLPYDFRPRFREGQAQGRALGLYIQKYCGCVYSEEERYCKKT